MRFGSQYQVALKVSGIGCMTSIELKNSKFPVSLGEAMRATCLGTRTSIASGFDLLDNIINSFWGYIELLGNCFDFFTRIESLVDLTTDKSRSVGHD